MGSSIMSFCCFNSKPLTNPPTSSASDDDCGSVWQSAATMVASSPAGALTYLYGSM